MVTIDETVLDGMTHRFMERVAIRPIMRFEADKVPAASYASPEHFYRTRDRVRIELRICSEIVLDENDDIPQAKHHVLRQMRQGIYGEYAMELARLNGELGCQLNNHDFDRADETHRRITQLIDKMMNLPDDKRRT